MAQRRVGEQLVSAYERHGEKLRFLIVGGWNTVFSLGTLWLLDHFIPYQPDNLVQKQAILLANWVLSVTHNFFTFKFLVFRSKGRWLREYLRMYVTYSATFIVQSVMTLAISQVLHWRVFWASLPTIAVVTVMSYLGHKYFTFRTIVPEEEEEVAPVFSEGEGLESDEQEP